MCSASLCVVRFVCAHALRPLNGVLPLQVLLLLLLLLLVRLSLLLLCCCCFWKDLSVLRFCSAICLVAAAHSASPPVVFVVSDCLHLLLHGVCDALTGIVAFGLGQQQ